MTSRATVRRKTGAMTTDERGREVPAWEVVHENLPTRQSGTAGNASPYRTRNVGGAEFTVAARIQHFPASTTDLRDGDLVEITAGENAGAVLQIIEADWQDQATARRVPVVAVDRPKEW